jgi:DNA-binding transcriptional MerR regulator
MKPLLLNLPDRLADWRGTAAELAHKCNELLQNVPALAHDAGSANERLVRHYVQAGILTPPEREGREALFGLRQVVEFLATRYLLKDGWPLAKVGELVRATGDLELTRFIPAERPRTQAEAVVNRLRGSTLAEQRSPTPVMARSAAVADAMPHHAMTPSLERAAEFSQRRVSLEENLKALGNADGRPDRRRIVRISLTPWCEVQLDAGELEGMSDDTPEILGLALTQALQDERTKKGDSR